MTNATRNDVILTPAANSDNFGYLWYAMIGHRCIAMIANTDTPAEIAHIIDTALAVLNAETEAYMATIS